MPLPTPKPGEDKNSFISRCVGSEAIRGEFSTQDQRVAVCYAQYEKKEKRATNFNNSMKGKKNG